MTKVKIKIPRANENEVAVIPEGNLGFEKKVNRRFEKIDNLLFGVIAAVVVSLVAVVVSVIGLFIEQMRYNNAAYKDYSESVETLSSLRDSNNKLLEQINENQIQILEQREQLLNILNQLDYGPPS